QTLQDLRKDGGGDPRQEEAVDLGYFGVRRLLSDAGGAFPAAGGGGGGGGGRGAAGGRGGGRVGPQGGKPLPQAGGPGAGGGARGGDRVVAADAEMHARLHAPSYSVEAMADLSDGVELIVGVRWDPRFGPVAMVGLGGIFTEILKDVAFALAPVSVTGAERLL